MFSRITQSIFFVIVVTIAVLAQAQPAPSRQEQAGRTSIIIDRQPISVLGKEFLHRGAGVIPRSILHEDQMPVRLHHHLLEKGGILRKQTCLSR